MLALEQVAVNAQGSAVDAQGLMLSFTRGEPIAAIVDGRFDGKILRLVRDVEENEPPDRKLDDEDVFDILDEQDLKTKKERFRMLNVRDRMKLQLAIQLGQMPLDDHLADAYSRARGKVDEQLKKELLLPDGCMVIIPNRETERVFIAGKSGSGKSTLAALYMREYLEMFPDRRVILISRHKDERAYKSIKHVALPLELFEGAAGPSGRERAGFEDDGPVKPIELTDIKDSLVVFDDTDNIQDKEVMKILKALNDDIISNGRKYNIHCLTLAHQLMEWGKTRNLLNEANKVIFFNSGSKYHIERYLKQYAGLKKEDIKKIEGLKSRWTMISNTIPMYVVHEHGAFIL